MFGFMNKPQLPNLQQTVVNMILIVNIRTVTISKKFTWHLHMLGLHQSCLLNAAELVSEWQGLPMIGRGSHKNIQSISQFLHAAWPPKLLWGRPPSAPPSALSPSFSSAAMSGPLPRSFKACAQTLNKNLHFLASASKSWWIFRSESAILDYLNKTQVSTSFGAKPPWQKTKLHFISNALPIYIVNQNWIIIFMPPQCFRTSF